MSLCIFLDRSVGYAGLGRTQPEFRRVLDLQLLPEHSGTMPGMGQGIQTL